MSMKHDVRTCTFPTAILLAIALMAGCGGMTTSPPSTSVSPPSANGTGDRVALGANNPAQGDCTTNTSETATSVGFVVLTLTPSSFEADVQLESGFPNTTYGVFMQQVPGSCPQSAANGGTLTTDSTGRGQASTEIARVPSAITFYVQLVPAGVGPPDYTSDRIAATS